MCIAAVSLFESSPAQLRLLLESNEHCISLVATLADQKSAQQS